MYIIQKIEIEACYRLHQYGKGDIITCKCSNCIGKTDTQMRVSLDKIYKSNQSNKS